MMRKISENDKNSISSIANLLDQKLNENRPKFVKTVPMSLTVGLILGAVMASALTHYIHTRSEEASEEFLTITRSMAFDLNMSPEILRKTILNSLN